MDSRSGKRGRANVTKEASTTKKVAKLAVTKSEEAVEVAEEVVARWWSGLDEQMEWASCWFPFWEAKENAYESLYGDVWDSNIWDFKIANNSSSPKSP